MKSKKEENGIKKKSKLGLAGLASNVGKFVSDVTDKSQEFIMNTIDKNEDGKIGLDDFGIEKEDIAEVKEKVQRFSDETIKSAKSFAVKAKESVQQGAKQLDKALAESRIERDKKALRPVFPEDLFASSTKQSFLSAEEESIHNMIRVVERDKKREENVVSKGAIGYWTEAEGISVLNIYEDIAKDMGVNFYPLVDKTVYYIHPFQENFYINLEEYFEYLKRARVSELEMIASELGAKRVTITLKESKSSVFNKNMKSKISAPKLFNATGSYDSKGTEFVGMEIAADLTFTGHNSPRIPNLVYFKGESDIEQLIKLRTDPGKENRLLSKTYSLQYNKSSGIKENAASQIDAALVSMKCNISISREAQRETRTILEYHIEF